MYVLYNMPKSHSYIQWLLMLYKHFIMISEADQPPSFSSEELKKFEKKFDNGYDLQHDERYNLWLKHFHGSSTVVIAEG